MAADDRIRALINRTETQARDVFDLKWLLDQGANPRLNSFSVEEIQTAIGNIRGIHYSDFKGQVVAYLMAEYKQFYDLTKWDDICKQVVSYVKRNK